VSNSSGALARTEVSGGASLPFTGFPLWTVAMTAIALIAGGLVLRRRSSL
jgi:CBS-domain-containing membrane protein